MYATDSTDLPGLRVRADSCFVDAKGKQNRSVEKNRRKLLEKAAPLVGKVLEEGEEVLLITPICSPFSILELLTTGWIIQNVKAAVLVVTDRRLLHLPTTASRRPRGSVAEVRYGDLATAKVSGWVNGKLVLEYREGGKETFTGIPMFSIKQLRSMVSARVGRGPATANGGRRFLCPGCRRVLPREPGRCTACGMEFRSRKKALTRSILIPGGGYFYTGHPLMGVADAAVEAFLLLFVLVGGGLALAGEPGMVEGVALFAVVLVFEKLVTVYHANHYIKEFLPVDRKSALAPPAGQVGEAGRAAPIAP